MVLRPPQASSADTPPRTGVHALLCLGLLGSFACGGAADVNDIRAHQRAWQAQNSGSYVFVYFEGCFCATPDQAGIRVLVDGDKAVNAFGVSNGLPAEGQARTIDDLFDEAIAEASLDPDTFTIHYDGQRSFIDKLQVDPDSNAEDDSSSLSVRCFATEATGCPVATLSEAECAEMNGVVTPVNHEHVGLTCGAVWPGAVGQISTQSDHVCCVRRT